MKKTLLAAMAMVSLCAHAQLAVEGFETWPVTGWTTHGNGGIGITWQQANGTTSQPPYSGSHSAFLDKENVPNGTVAQDWLVSPLFQVPENTVIRFASRLTIAGDQGSVYKLLLLPSTGNPDVLSDYVTLQQWTELELNPLQTDYILKNVAIPAAYTGTMARFAFYMEGDDADRWLVDDVRVHSVCNDPSELSATFDGISADLSWTENGDATAWEIEVVSVTNAPTGSGVVYSGSLPYTVTGLVPEVAYKYYVRALCPDGGQSNWVGPFGFGEDTVNVVHGRLDYDSNNDGICDDNNGPLFSNIPVSVTIDGVYAYTVYTNSDGVYSLYGISDGAHTLALQVMPSPGLEEQPVLVEEIDFDESEVWLVTHCMIIPEEPFNNLVVNILTYANPRPGFDIAYMVKVKNLGTIDSEDVTVALEFDSARLEFIAEGSSFNGVVSGNVITLTVGDVEALGQEFGYVNFHVKQPPVNVGGEVINFAAVLSPVEDDIDMTNNTSVYEDIIVNSYDPNDITVHEGAKIKEDEVTNYLTYTIRFQNTGTAEAINIKLENELDDLLDWETFETVDSSHGYEVERNGNLLEFEYKDIFLPDSTSNEPGSHGHITYRIKPKAGFGIGDIVSNTAEIYFDFNEAIVTNTATTEVVEILGLNDNALAIAKLYPNPVKDQLHIEVAQGELQSVVVYDINGRLCLSANNSIIDTYTLKSGIYFVKVTTDAGSGSYKLIKH